MQMSLPNIKNIAFNSQLTKQHRVSKIHMKIQNLFIALTTSVLAVSSIPSWSIAAGSIRSSQNVTKQAPPTLIAQVVYATTRTNRTCPSRVNPQRGGISLEQAKTYFICRYETFTGPRGKIGSSYNFVDNLKMQMAAARPPTSADLGLGYKEDINLKQPVYPIKVSYTGTGCPAYNSQSQIGEAAQGKCLVRDEVTGVGICFRSNFGEWHCKTRPTGSTEMRWAKPGWTN
jgi:hypothetical protein